MILNFSLCVCIGMKLLVYNVADHVDVLLQKAASFILNNLLLKFLGADPCYGFWVFVFISCLI